MPPTFIPSHASDGSLVWVRQIGGANNASGNDIATGPDSSLYATGYFVEEAVFGPGEPNETHLKMAGGENIFIAKFHN